MKIGVILLGVIASATAREAITVNPGTGSWSLTDLTGTGLLRKFCVTDRKECTGADVEANFAGTEFQCHARCSQRRDCLSAFFADNKVCHIRSERCAANELTPADGKDFYRLKEGESCPADRPQYQPPEHTFGNTFCMMWGHTCKGDPYYRKPASIATYEECLIKCTKIRTCSMVNYDHVNKKCEPLLSTCADEDLDKNDNIQNFLRLPKGETECPGNRGPPSPQPPPPTEPPTEPPEPPTEAPTEPPPPVNLDCGGKKYVDKVFVKRGRKEVIASCNAGCSMTVCHCRPYKHCDGARFTSDGKCRVTRRTRNGKIINKKKRIYAHIKCEPFSRVETEYISTTVPNTPLRCGEGWDRRGDCTFYAIARSRKMRSLRKRKGMCGVNRYCGKIGRCTATAVCLKRKAKPTGKRRG